MFVLNSNDRKLVDFLYLEILTTTSDLKYDQLMKYTLIIHEYISLLSNILLQLTCILAKASITESHSYFII